MSDDEIAQLVMYIAGKPRYVSTRAHAPPRPRAETTPALPAEQEARRDLCVPARRLEQPHGRRSVCSEVDEARDRLLRHARRRLRRTRRCGRRSRRR